MASAGGAPRSAPGGTPSSPNTSKSSQTSSFARPSPAPARAKRVPDSQRRRAAVSCDHCKQRRAKCMRASPRDPCSNCIGNRIKCQSTLPRKQRVYGSVESLSLRYRALEALVKGLLQDEEGTESGPTSGAVIGTGADDNDNDNAMVDTPTHQPALDLDALYSAAAARGIPMPPREDMTPVSEIFASTDGKPGPAPTTIVPAPLTSPGPAVPSSSTSSTATPISLPIATSMQATARPTAPMPLHPLHPLPHQHQLPTTTTLTTPTADEKLIPTPHGVAHYVGPSSSFRFVTSIRALVAQCGDNIGGSDLVGGAGVQASDAAGEASPATGSEPGAGGISGGDGTQSSQSAPSASGSGASTDATAGPTSASIRDEFVGLKTSKALEVQDSSGGDEDESDDGSSAEEDGESDGESAEYGYGGDAMDDIVLEDKHHPLQSQPQPSPLPYQSPVVPYHAPQPPHQHTLPARQYTPQSGGASGSSGGSAGVGGGPLSAPSPANSRRSRFEFDDAANAASFLPPRETANIFVRVFFDRVHPNYPLFHRGSFMLRYEALWQKPPNEQTPLPQGGMTPSPMTNPRGPGAADTTTHPQERQDDYGWNCCLAMAFAFGAQVLEDHDRARRAAAGMQRRYLNLVRSSLSRLCGTTNLANVQALLLLQLYEHNAGQRNAAWTFLGCASRMAVALGMHRDGVGIPVTPMGPPEPKSGGTNTNSSQKRGGGSLLARAAAAATLPASASTPDQVTDRNDRRRVWWTLYQFERGLCIMLGRPSALDEAEIAVAAPTDDSQYPELPQGHSASLLRLIRIAWRIKQMVFPAPGSAHSISGNTSTAYNAYYPGSTDPTTTPRILLAELDAWRASLPAHLQPGWKSTDMSHRRAVLLLHVEYQYVRSLATRQYVLERADRCRIKAQALSPSTAATSSSPGIKETAAASASDEAVDELADICLNGAERVLDYCRQLADIGQLDGVAWIDIYFLYHSVLVICLDLLARIVTASAAAKAKDKDKGKENDAAADSKADVTAARRRTAVRSVLQITQRTRLAPTFRVLVLVACQLAAIVGALDGLPNLPAAASASGSTNATTAEAAELAASNKHHHPSHGSSARSGGSLATTSTKRGRGRRRRNSSSMSRERTTSRSRGPYPSTLSVMIGGASSVPNASMAPPPPSVSTVGHNTTSTMSDASSPANVFYSPVSQYQPQQHQHQFGQQQQHQQQHHHQHQHDLHMQQLQTFGGADWFASDPAAFPWQVIDARSLGMGAGGGAGASGAGLPPNANVAAPVGPVNVAAAAAAAAAAQFPVAFYTPQGIDFGLTTDTSTFGEDPYVAGQPPPPPQQQQQQQQQQHSMYRAMDPAASSSGSVPPPTAAFAAGMDLEPGQQQQQPRHPHHPHRQQQQQQQHQQLQHHQQHQQYPQQPPQLDNNEWIQIWREVKNRYQ
ncbi:uncharacterized protein SPSK_02152 [Sporothrix schenckii 1099-18]|uniref:Zn(2)-C6 fungal-type domain-containing protein n=1 Tax=Sporothrix schenckii 1099-18 TaxID=1397361 RepID=A0A0F2MBT9_SPOSC|nr:uncharacterized protein SPSK_02152 [Sporothrix schenckii 1099-18]KJR86305.1 hypothetical protein SPSK_02152 [Sporothrix schenckii 1099-18]